MQAGPVASVIMNTGSRNADSMRILICACVRDCADQPLQGRKRQTSHRAAKCIWVAVYDPGWSLSVFQGSACLWHRPDAAFELWPCVPYSFRYLASQGTVKAGR